jgi:hypothetical protein
LAETSHSLSDHLERIKKDRETSIVTNQIEACQLRQRGACDGCRHRNHMLQSAVPCTPRRGSPRSFPQLWKKMWKSKAFWATGTRT